MKTFPLSQRFLAMNRKFWMFAAILLLAVRLPCAAVTAPDIGEGVLDDPNYRPPSSGGGSTSSGGGYSRPTYQQPQVDYEAIRRQQQMERQRIEAERRRQAAEAERKRKEEAARQLQLKRNAEAASAAKAWAAEDAANDNADAPQKGKSNASQIVKKGLPALLRKTQKLPCGFCVNGWRDCPSCEGGAVHCHRSGCRGGWETCGCVKSQNNYQPAPDCRFCHGSGRTKCEACGGKSAGPCPDCQRKGKLPCPFCEAGTRAASSASGSGPAAGYAASAPAPAPGAYPPSTRVAAQQSLLTRIIGPNPAAKPLAQDLEHLSQAQKKLAEEDKRLAEATTTRPPQNPVPPDLAAAQKALEERELLLIQQAMDKLSGGDVPSDPAKKQALVDQIKADFAKDPERIKLLTEVARLEAAAPMPGVAAQQLAKATGAVQGFAGNGGNSVLVPSFSATVPLLPGATPAVSGSLGKPVGYSEGMIKEVAKRYETWRWNDEARLVETRQTIQNFQTAVGYFDQEMARAKADYEKIKGNPGAPATFDAYLNQRRAADPSASLDFWWRNIESQRAGYQAALRREKRLMEEMDGRSKYMKEIIDGNPEGPKVAAKVRQETMDERIKQLEQIVESQKQAVAKRNAKMTEFERNLAKQEAAYQRRLEAERPKAQAEYDQLDPKRKAAQDFDSYLFAKMEQTPEAKAYLARFTDGTWIMDLDLSDNVNRAGLQEAQQKLQALRQRGTLLGGSEWWSKQAATLRPKLSYDDRNLEFFSDWQDFY